MDELDSSIARTQDAMKRASQIVLDGFELETDVKSVVHPERYSDERGVVMWNTVLELIENNERKVAELTGDPAHP